MVRKKIADRCKPCEKCETNLWKTKIKHKSWECKYCGNIRTKGE